MHDPNRRNASLDDYLAQVGRGLSRLPEADRDAELAELRHHLTELAGQFQAEGDLEPEKAALRQFGKASSVAARIHKVWWRGQRGGLLRAAALAFTLTTMASSLAFSGPAMILIRTLSQQVGQPFIIVLILLLTALWMCGGGFVFGRYCQGRTALWGGLAGFLLSSFVFYLPQYLRNPTAFSTPLIGGVLFTDLLLFPWVASWGVRWGNRYLEQKKSAPALLSVILGLLTITTLLAIPLRLFPILPSYRPVGSLGTWSFAMVVTSIWHPLSYAIGGWLLARRTRQTLAPSILKGALLYQIGMMVYSNLALISSGLQAQGSVVFTGPFLFLIVGSPLLSALAAGGTAYLTEGMAARRVKISR